MWAQSEIRVRYGTELCWLKSSNMELMVYFLCKVSTHHMKLVEHKQLVKTKVSSAYVWHGHDGTIQKFIMLVQNKIWSVRMIYKANSMWPLHTSTWWDELSLSNGAWGSNMADIHTEGAIQITVSKWRIIVHKIWVVWNRSVEKFRKWLHLEIRQIHPKY